MIRLEKVNKYYQSGTEKVWAIKDLTLQFPETGLIFILGPSGCGKSTLLNLLGGLDNPDTGEIYIENRILSSFKKQELNNYLNSYLGFVFQEYNIFQDLNLFENISLSLELQGVKKKEINQRVAHILDDVELTPFKDRKIHQLSGGQRQRIAIARALIKQPRLIIADEPTGNLDSVTSDTIFELFKKFSDERLIIIVSHDEESAHKFGDQIIKINDGMLEETINKIDNSASIPQENEKLTLIKATVPLALSTKISFKRIWKKKIRFLMMALICALSLAFLSFTIELNDDKIRQNVYTVVGNNYNYVNVYERAELPSSYVKSSVYDDYQYTQLAPNSYDRVREAIPEITLHQYQIVNISIPNIDVINKNYLYPGTIQHVIKFDINNNYTLLAGRLPVVGSKEIMITDYMVGMFNHFNTYGGASSYYDYLGKLLDLEVGQNYTIVGIIKTNYTSWLHFAKFSDINEIDDTNKQNLSYLNDYKAMNAVYLDTTNFNIERNGIPNQIIHNKYPVLMYLSSTGNVQKADLNLIDYTSTTNESALVEYIPDRGRPSVFGRNVVNPNEIVISLNIAHTLLGIDIKSANGNTASQWVRNMNDGQYKVQMTIYDYDDELLRDITYQVVGISTELYANTIEIHQNDQEGIYKLLNNSEYLMAELPKDQEAAYEFFKSASQNNYVLDVFAYRADIDAFTVDPFINLIAQVGLFVFAIFTIGILWTIITLEIVDSRREIGIFRSIGLSGGKVSLIFIIQSLFVGIIAYGIGLVLGNYATNYYSAQIMDELKQVNLSMFMQTYRSPLFLFIFMLAIITVAMTIPLYRIMSQKIIDVINERDNL